MFIYLFVNLFIYYFFNIFSQNNNNKKKWDIDDDQFQWMERAWQGLSPEQGYQNSEEKTMWELCGPPDKRIGLLQKLYLQLDSCSFLKAKAAFVMVFLSFD